MKLENLLFHWVKQSPSKERWMHRLQVTDFDLLVCLIHLEMFPKRSPPKLYSWITGSSPMLLQAGISPANSSELINLCLKTVFSFCSRM